MLKILQLGVSVGLLVLVWQIYPGNLRAIAGAVAASYVIASIIAMRNARIAIWIAFDFSLLTFAFSVWGVYRYFDNGFDYLSGNFEGRSGIYWPAYLFLLVALGSLTVIVLHILSRRWMLRPKEYRAG